MAKTGLFGGNAWGAPTSPAPTSTSMPAAIPARGGMFPGLSSGDRYDMVTSLLQGAVNGAGQMNSPLASFLMPVLATMMGAKAAERRDTERSAEVSRMTETLLGPAGVPQSARAALSVLQNPDAPDYLQSIATTMFKDATKGVGHSATSGAAPRRSSSGGGSSAGGTPARTRVYGEPFAYNGVMVQRDGYGNFVPVKGPDGKAVAAPDAAVPPVNATDPLGINQTQAATTPENDPLGIR